LLGFELNPEKVVELGAGTALAGLCAASLSRKHARVVLTDLPGCVVTLKRKN
jgi:tRNA1(Val) A37 N6-methylase TrmN6